MNDPLIITHAKKVKSKDAPLEIVEDIIILASTENMLNGKKKIKKISLSICSMLDEPTYTRK